MQARCKMTRTTAWPLGGLFLALFVAHCGGDNNNRNDARKTSCESPAMLASFTGDDLYTLTVCNEASDSYVGQVAAANGKVHYLYFKDLTISGTKAAGDIADYATDVPVLAFDLTVDPKGSYFTGTTTYEGTSWTWSGFTTDAVEIHFDDVGRLVEGQGSINATRLAGQVELQNGSYVTLRLYLYVADYSGASVPVMQGWMLYTGLGYVSTIDTAEVFYAPLAQGPATAVLANAVLAVWAQNPGINLGP